jgi:hypothetical protein
MRLTRYVLIFAFFIMVACAVTAIVLAARVSATYQPIKSYSLTILKEEACSSSLVPIRVKGEINPPVESLIVDPTWVRMDKEGYQEEPVAEFTGDQLPVKINRVSPLAHIAPKEEGTYVLTENLVAEGEFRGVNRTQDFATRSENSLRVVECAK